MSGSDQGKATEEEIRPDTDNLPAVTESRYDADEELRHLISLERERLESNNRRTEVMRLAIETNDAADRRQFDYRMASLQSSDLEKKSRFTLARTVIYASMILGGLAIALLFYMAFFGSDGQSVIAVRFLLGIATALGGYGLIEGAKRAFSSLIH